MTHKALVLAILFSQILCCELLAQQGVVSAGGDIVGEGGTVSSSSGQTDFFHIGNEQWSLQFGLQQAHKMQLIPIVPEPPADGTIAGAGNYPIGTQVTLTAQANPGYEFYMWVGNFTEVNPNKQGSQSTNNPIVIIVEEDTYISAIFQLSDPVAIPIAPWAMLLAATLIMAYSIRNRKIIS